MGTQVGYNNPEAATISATWTGATNVFASDASDASITANNTDSLRPQTFDFALPQNCIIRGIEVSIEGEGDNATQVNRDLDVSITLDGSAAAGTSKTFSLPQTTDGIVEGGGVADLWGIVAGLDVAEVNASTFGVHIVKNTAIGTVNIDHVVVRVYYDEGVRGEFKIDFDTKRITHKDMYFDYDTGAAGTAPAVGDVIFNTGGGAEVTRVVEVHDWSVLAFGTLTLGESHSGALADWADNDTLELCSYVTFDTEVNGGLSEEDIGSAFTVTGGTGTRTGVIRHVESDGTVGTMWWDPTGQGGTAFVGDETIQISAVSRASASAAETSNAWTGAVNTAPVIPARNILNYDAETASFENITGSKRLRDTLGFQHNMVVCDVTTGATAMVMNDRENQLVSTEGTLFLLDQDGTFTNDNVLEACVEIDFDTEVNGGFFDLIGLANELEGATSLATATVRRVIQNGTTGTLYVTGVTGGPFTAGEVLRKNTGDQTRGNMTTDAQRDRVGGATINGSVSTATAAFFSTQDVFSDNQDVFDELIALEDDASLEADVRDQGYRMVNDWLAPFYSLRWNIKGAVSQHAEVGGSDTDSIHTNYFHLGSFENDALTNVYVDQNASVIEQFWPAGTFEFLLRNKNKNVEIAAGANTFEARLFGDLYDFATVSAIGLRNPVGLNTSNDSNNASSYATVRDGAVYHAIMVMFASHTINFDTGSNPAPTVGSVVYNATALEAGQVCRPPDSNISGTDLHLASKGVDFATDWGDGETLTLLDHFDFDAQVNQFVVGEAIENAADTWNATVRYVQQFGASRGRVWFSNATGTLANDEVVRLNGNAGARATCDGGEVTAGTWTALTNTASCATADTTVLKDIGDGGGDQPYYAVLDCNGATATQLYEFMKFLANEFAGSATDLGGILYPDNIAKQGRVYEKAAAAVSNAVIKKQSPLGTKAGALVQLATGIFIEDIAAADAQNYELIDVNAVTRSPPNLQSVSVGGLEVGDPILVARRAEIQADGTDTIDFNTGTPATIDVNGTGDFLDKGFRGVANADGTLSIVITGTTSNNKTVAVADVTASLITLATGETLTNEAASSTALLRGDNINKDMFSGAAGNNSGDADFVVAETIDADLPSSGTFIVQDKDGSEAYEDEYSYSSYTASTFTLASGTLVRTYTTDARVWVPFIRKNAAAATESQTYIHSVEIPVKIKFFKKGFKTFEQDNTVTATGLSAQVVRSPDGIVE